MNAEFKVTGEIFILLILFLPLLLLSKFRLIIINKTTGFFFFFFKAFQMTCGNYSVKLPIFLTHFTILDTKKKTNLIASVESTLHFDCVHSVLSFKCVLKS